MDIETQLAENLDFSTFDIELFHAKVRHFIEKSVWEVRCVCKLFRTLSVGYADEHL